MTYQINVAGVDGLIVSLAGDINRQMVSRIVYLCQLLEQQPLALIDLVPSYNTLYIRYDLNQYDYAQVFALVEATLVQLDDEQIPELEGRTHKIPVCYESDYAPDLEQVADLLSLSCEQLIELHQRNSYQVFTVGFSPGFGYLGLLDQRLQLPRKATPITAVPAGSVAIAEAHTAVYPQQTPGGWWLIGRTPIAMYDKQRQPAALLQTGDKVEFYPISAAEFQRIEHATQEIQI